VSKLIDLKRLRAVRAYNGYSQTQVEKLTGIKNATYAPKERGENKITIEESIKLAKLYKMTLYEYNEIFLGGELTANITNDKGND
jgi:transcriptional regulator with XRE-family HTH domain